MKFSKLKEPVVWSLTDEELESGRKNWIREAEFKAWRVRFEELERITINMALAVREYQKKQPKTQVAGVKEALATLRKFQEK
jgi:hypothetical protein